MMLRSQIDRNFRLDQTGCIVNPGLFHGQPIWTPYYYDLYCDGIGYTLIGEIAVFEVLTEDRREFPELGETDYIRLAVGMDETTIRTIH